MLDIHQISIGRGNAGLYFFPDGTTLLVDVVEDLKIGKLLDRGWPDYSNATQPKSPFMKNYLAFVKTLLLGKPRCS